MASYSRSDYTRAETHDTTTNVPLLSDDLLDDDGMVGLHQDPVLVVTDDVEDNQAVRFSVSLAHSGTGIRFPCKFTKTVGLLAIIAVLIIICAVLSALLTRKSVKHVNTTLNNICVTDNTPLNTTANNICVTEGCIDAAYHMFHSMDRSVHPCDDFYEFACGGWMQNHPIPESESFWGVYSILQEENERLVKQLLTATEKGSKTIMKAKTFYDACMDETAIDAMGATPLQDIIKDLGGWNITSPWNQSKFDFEGTLKAVQKKYSVSPFFRTAVGPDDKNSSKNIIQVDQGGLPLSRTYYLLNMSDPKLKAYLKYMTTVGTLLGGKEIATREQMKEVLEFEMKLAKIFVPPENRSQIDEIYNKTTIAKLKKLCYEIPWLEVFQNYFHGIAQIKEEEEVVVYATRYLEALSPVIQNTSITTLNNYMMWQVVSTMAPMLSKEFRDAHEELMNVLTGTKKSEDLWKRCMGQTDTAIGMALGALFIQKAFEGSSKEQATDMIDAIRASFKKSLSDLDWMDDKTRLAADAKADYVVDMIGFPDYIRDPPKLEQKYDGLNFEDKKYFKNVRNSDDFHLLDNLKTLRKPVDKHKWYMTPPTVNAYYSPSRNQIVFPAGILQPPYYNKKFPKAVNFGGIGAVVGHELSHGFDNSGRMYDKYGNYGVQWWTNSSVKQYKTRSQCMVKQYSRFSYFGKNVNGKFTLGENIADNGGLKAAYNAYKEWEKKNGAEPPLPLLNMTAEQTFFTAFAQSWCANIRKQDAVVRLDDDPHSPNKFRVLGSLFNSEAFAGAFSCSLGSKMNPSSKCHIW